MESDTFIVICMASRTEGGSGGYELATRTVFETREDADTYAAGISISRAAIVIPGRFRSLRFDSRERFKATPAAAPAAAPEAPAEAPRIQTFAFKVYTGPTSVKEVARRLQEAGFVSVSEGTEHVYFTYESASIEDAKQSAKANMVRAGFSDLFPKKV